MNFLQQISQSLDAISVFNEFKAHLETIPDTIDYVENERLMLIVKGFKYKCPSIYNELEAAAHLDPDSAVDRLDALYPGCKLIRQFDNWPRMVKAIQLIITANERREEQWRVSGSTSPLARSLQSSKRVSKTRKRKQH